MKQIAAIYDVDVERLRKEAYKVRIQGQESSVEEAKLAVLKWVREWKSKNIGESVTVDKNLFPLLIGTHKAMVDKISQETNCTYDFSRKTFTFTLFGNEQQISDFLKRLENLIVKAQDSIEKETTKETKTTLNEREKNGETLNNNNHVAPEKQENIETNHTESVTPASSFTQVGNGSDQCNIDEEQIIDVIEEEHHPQNGGMANKISVSIGATNLPRSSSAGKDLFQMLTDSSASQRKLIQKHTSRPVKTSGVDERSTGTDASEEASSSVESQQKIYKSSSGFTVRV